MGGQLGRIPSILSIQLGRIPSILSIQLGRIPPEDPEYT